MDRPNEGVFARAHSGRSSTWVKVMRAVDGLREAVVLLPDCGHRTRQEWPRELNAELDRPRP